MMRRGLERDVRFLKFYAGFSSVVCSVLLLTAFTRNQQLQRFEEVTTSRIKFVDPDGKEQAHVGVQSSTDGSPGLLFYDKNGKGRLRIGAEVGKGAAAGLLFYNEEQTEAGALLYRGKRDQEGKIIAGSIFTMDQFKDDQIIFLEYNQNGDQKRQGLVISDRPNVRSPQAEKLLEDLRLALQSAKSETDAQTIRRKYLSMLPGREIVA